MVTESSSHRPTFLARNIWTMIRMVSSKIPAWLNQPSDEHMQVVRNLRHRDNCETIPTVSVVAA